MGIAMKKFFKVLLIGYVVKKLYNNISVILKGTYLFNPHPLLLQIIIFFKVSELSIKFFSSNMTYSCHTAKNFETLFI